MKTKIFPKIIILIVAASFILGIGTNKSFKLYGITGNLSNDYKSKLKMNNSEKDTNKNQNDSLADIINSQPDEVIMETSLGNMTIELYPKDAPIHVANFKKLVYNHFYDGLLFHRVINGFMIQGGDPNTRNGNENTWGTGGPGYTIPAEIKLKHVKGSLAAARMGDQVNPKRESSGSQFYIVTGQASFLDGQYTVYGEVIEGLDVADKIQNVKTNSFDRPLDKVVINKVYFAQ